MHDYRLHARAVDQRWRWGHIRSRAEINREEAEATQVRGCVCLCRNEGLFRVGGLLPANCVFPALCLPINWPCGLSTARLAATERSQVLWENTATALHSVWGAEKSEFILFFFCFISRQLRSVSEDFSLLITISKLHSAPLIFISTWLWHQHEQPRWSFEL